MQENAIKPDNKYAEVVKDHWGRVRGLTDQLPRREDSLVRARAPKGQVQVVIGMQGCGKDVLCQTKLMKKRIDFALLRFWDERLQMLKPGEFHLYLDAIAKAFKDPWLLIEEPQHVECWPLFVERALKQGYRVILTSSDASLLENKYAYRLREKCRVIRLMPLCFADFIFFTLCRTGCGGEKVPDWTELHALMDYGVTGGGCRGVSATGRTGRPTSTKCWGASSARRSGTPERGTSSASSAWPWR